MPTTETTTLKATLRGIRPIMFDRYAGDNKTKLEPLDMFYLNPLGQCTIPVLNLFSLLSAQNTPSVAKRFYGKGARDVALGVQAFVNIEADGEEPMEAVITDDQGVPYTPKDERIRIMDHVARVDKGIPNPKKRPVIPSNWKIKIKLEHQTNQLLTVSTLQKMLEQGGLLGLGTFRPIFGRFTVEWS